MPPTIHPPTIPATLKRLPLLRQDSLQAWDAADEYLLNHAHERGLLKPQSRILVVNDAFGALAVALIQRGFRVTSWSDSYLGGQALRYNLNEQRADPDDDIDPNFDRDGVTFVPGDEDPQGPFDLVLMQLPKSLAWLEDSLLRLRHVLTPDAIVLTGGMIKHTPASAYKLLEDCIGPTQTTLGWKKARLAVSQMDVHRMLPEKLPDVSYFLESEGLTLSDRSSLFSRGKLDLGTRLLLAHLPSTPESFSIADIGCGNGVLSLALARRCPNASILGVDDSYQAVAAARGNAAAAGFASEREDWIRFRVGNGLSAVPASSLDWVVTNPPFHLSRAMGDQVAWAFMQQAYQTLKPGGRFLLVGNRHLGYYLKLKRRFGRYDIAASNAKFVVLSARR